MPWSGSGINAAPVYLTLISASYTSGWAKNNVFKAALFNDTVTPDRDLGGAAYQYGMAPWLPQAEVSNNPYWPPGGLRIPNSGGANGIVQTLDEVRFTGGPVTSSGPVTIIGARGDAVWDSSVALNVVHCFHDFGGDVDVNSGLLTIMWDPGGVMAMVAAAPPGAPLLTETGWPALPADVEPAPETGPPPRRRKAS